MAKRQTTKPKNLRPEDRVDCKSVAYTEQACEWDLLNDLRGGTFTMRDAATKWLPLFPKEDQADYNLRLHSSFLYPKYGDTVESLGSKPFSKPIILTGDLPEPLKSLETNVDKTGTDLTQFIKNVFTEGIDKGITFVLVDYPEINPKASLADERAVGARPVFVHYKAEDVWGWKEDKAENGEFVLQEVRLHEVKLEPVGKYGDQAVDYIRIIRDNGTWELHRKDPTEDHYTLFKQGGHSFKGIPLVQVYINKTGFMTGKPALKYLAELNLAHWQSYSDQRNFLRFARIGLLFASGFTDEEQEKIVVAPNRFIKTSNENAELKYVEHTGQAIGAGRDDLKDLEKEMEIVGAQPLMEKGKSGGASATGRAIDEARTQADIQSWIRSGETAIQQMYRKAAEWMKVKIPDNFQVDVFSDFVTSLRPSEEIASLVQATVQGKMTNKTFLTEMKRRGLISDFVDIDAEVAALEKLKGQDHQNALELVTAKSVQAPDKQVTDASNA